MLNYKVLTSDYSDEAITAIALVHIANSLAEIAEHLDDTPIEVKEIFDRLDLT